MMNRASFARSSLAVAGSLAASAAPIRARAATRIRMAAVATETFGVPLYAKDSGAFDRAGLDVDLQFFPSAAPANVALTAGAIDVAVADPLQLTNAINHGLPYQYFAGGLMHEPGEPTTALCVANDGPKSARDLEGMTIAVPTIANLASFGVREWMTKEGADPEKAHFIEFNNAAMASALTRGTVQAAMITEPYISSDSTTIRILSNPYDAISPRFLLNGFYARRDWLTENAETARRLATALYDGARWANTHHPESLAILIKYSKVEPARVSGMRRAVYATALDPALLRPVIAVGLKYKSIDKAVPLSDMIAKLA